MNVSETLSDRKYEGVGQDSTGAGMTTWSRWCKHLLNFIYVQ
jgi:predicted alpha/beta hydrolase